MCTKETAARNKLRNAYNKTEQGLQHCVRLTELTLAIDKLQMTKDSLINVIAAEQLKYANAIRLQLWEA